MLAKRFIVRAIVDGVIVDSNPTYDRLNLLTWVKDHYCETEREAMELVKEVHFVLEQNDRLDLFHEYVLLTVFVEI